MDIYSAVDFGILHGYAASIIYSADFESSNFDRSYLDYSYIRSQEATMGGRTGRAYMADSFDFEPK